MQKLDIHETASLVRYAIRRGLVQPEDFSDRVSPSAFSVIPLNPNG